MAIYEFKVEEVNRDGYIAWDAIEESTGNRIALNTSGKHSTGSYPEIGKYLEDTYGINVELEYQEDTADVFDQGKQEWRFVRGTDEIVVKDILRTVFRIAWER
ncbi:hypothetical protein [Aliidiomarina soli]|uniref:Uncharacterized protein n=1 Tax=Aliidiomarina soli TaxID=1928574 RepID=A0A432WC30_9GAMM|nr:hypothetical protein [Aliidiomarina soli]RUO29545.1 hypothetical protein CWE14_13865 [Aliidiomarina soli]